MYFRRLSAIVLSTLVIASAGVRVRAGSDPAASAKKNAAAQKETAQDKPTFWILPHTHWEGAVFKTREEYLDIGLPNILTVLRLLKTHPEYRFSYDQMAFIKPFLDRYPEHAAEFRQYVAEGRLQIIGGTDVMPDVNMPSGESWARSALYGKSYFRDKLGVDVTVGWNIDTFGSHAQMPQLLKLAGYKSYWASRGIPTGDTPTEFQWQGIDGTQILTFHLGQAVGSFGDAPKNPALFEQFARNHFAALGPFTQGDDRLAYAMTTAVAEADVDLPSLVEDFNRKSGMPFTLKFGVPTDIESVVKSRGEPTVFAGEMNPVFQGIYSSRIEIKQWYREMERLLTTAEKLATVAGWLGLPVDRESLAQAWEPVLFNETHDQASGVMVDKVYTDAVRGYEFSHRLGQQMVGTWWDGLTSKIDTTGDGTPVVVFNSLGWTRSDLAEVNVSFTEADVTDIGLVDASGQPVPVQVEEAEHSADGVLKQAKIAFVARDVPALGYSVYHVIPKRGGPPAAMAGRSPMLSEDSASIENEFYKASFDLRTGEMTGLLVKSTNWQALNGPANVVTREQDGGDFWELYGNLGAGEIAQTRKVLLPQPGKTQWSSEWVGSHESPKVGPVYSEYRISHPFGNGDFATRVRLYAGIPRIDIHTQILNNDRFVRYRVLFPTSIKNGKRVDEIPFGAIERPSSEEFPAQNWFDYGDGTQGMAVLNRGLPGSNVVDGTLLLSLARSARITAYPVVEGYEEGVSSDSGLELGKRLTFDYALMPHDGDWRQAGTYRSGLEFNNPLIAQKVAAHAGTLPKRWGLLEVSNPNVVVSTLKPGPDGSAVLRVYEASGNSTPGVKIALHAQVESASETNLIEQPGAKLNVQGNALQFDLGAYQIKTFELRLGASRPR